MRRVARFIIREQMQPTFAFEILFGVMSRLHGAATRLMALAAGLDPAGAEAKLRVFLMIGQVLFLRIAEAAVLRRMQLERYDDAFLARGEDTGAAERARDGRRRAGGPDMRRAPRLPRAACPVRLRRVIGRRWSFRAMSTATSSTSRPRSAAASSSAPSSAAAW